ncbi:MAG: phosphoglycerate mutase [Candidatus Taylorbacteria bacterium]|nr:phosphoglycerate mutase [Candidatus Taylorbacteria bacterium]
MKILFVRHGKTKSNALGRVMSRSNDESLSEEGLAVVQQVVSESPIEFDVLYSSPLKRTHETALEFSKKYAKTVALHDAILEQDFGSLSNKTWEEINEITKGEVTHALWQTIEEIDFSAYGGETKEDVRSRLASFIGHVKQQHAGSVPLVVTHGGVLRVMYALYPNHAPKSIGNVSIHEFEV